MRPGPGLVVMALAFISGARRSTSQQSNPTIGSNSNLPKEEQTGFLAHINPWLSACDVANPITAPDLQVMYSSHEHTRSLTESFCGYGWRERALPPCFLSPPHS